MSTIRSKLGNKPCLDIQGGKTRRGANVGVWNCKSDAGGQNKGQKWFYDESTQQIKTGLKEDRCLAITGKDRTPGANVMMYNCKNFAKEQQWYYDPETKFIKSRLNNLCLDVTGGKILPKPRYTNVGMWNCKSKSNEGQKWNVPSGFFGELKSAPAPTDEDVGGTDGTGHVPPVADEPVRKDDDVVTTREITDTDTDITEEDEDWLWETFLGVPIFVWFIILYILCCFCCCMIMLSFV